MIYKTYTIFKVKSNQGLFNYGVKNKYGNIVFDDAPSIKTAKKWVDSIYSVMQTVNLSDLKQFINA